MKHKIAEHISIFKGKVKSKYKSMWWSCVLRKHKIELKCATIRFKKASGKWNESVIEPKAFQLSIRSHIPNSQIANYINYEYHSKLAVNIKTNKKMTFELKSNYVYLLQIK